MQQKAANGSGVRGTPWPKGKSGNPAGSAKRRHLLASATPITLTEAGRELIQALGGQLRMLREAAEKRELEDWEFQRFLGCAAEIRELEASRGRIMVELLKLDKGTVRELLAAFNGELPAQVQAVKA